MIDPATGLLVQAGDEALLRAVTAVQDRIAAIRAVQAAHSGSSQGLKRDPATGLLLGEGDPSMLGAVQGVRAASAPSAPMDPRVQGAPLCGPDLAGRGGLLSARFQTWDMSMASLVQEEMRIGHAFWQKMIRCNSLQAGANVMANNVVANIFAGPANGLSWSLGQLGAGDDGEDVPGASAVERGGGDGAAAPDSAPARDGAAAADDRRPFGGLGFGPRSRAGIRRRHRSRPRVRLGRTAR